MSITVPNKSIPNCMHSDELELSSLVGKEILIISDQLPHNSAYTKVVMVHENVISVDRSGTENEISSISNEELVIVQFDYKSQRLSVKAKFFRSDSGRIRIILDENVIPLSRRMFKRYVYDCKVRCAILPIHRIAESDISKLRWLQVDAINISSGGILLPIPSKLTDKTYLLLNIELENTDLPNLVVGQVRHSISINNFSYHIGVKFIPFEDKSKYFTALHLKKIPVKAFDYTIKHRNRFDKFLIENFSDRQE